MIVQIDIEQSAFLGGVVERARPTFERATTPAGAPVSCLGQMLWPTNPPEVREVERVRLTSARAERRSLAAGSNTAMVAGVTVQRVQLVIVAEIDGSPNENLRANEERPTPSERPLDIELRFDLTVEPIKAPGSSTDGMPCLRATFAEVTQGPKLTEMLVGQPGFQGAVTTALANIANQVRGPLNAALPCIPLPLEGVTDLLGIAKGTRFTRGGVAVDAETLSVRIEFAPLAADADWQAFFAGKLHVGITPTGRLGKLGFGGFRMLLDAPAIVEKARAQVTAGLKRPELKDQKVGVRWDPGPKLVIDADATVNVENICWVSFDSTTEVSFARESATSMLIRSATTIDVNNWDVLTCGLTVGGIFGFIYAFVGGAASGPFAIVGAIIGAIVGIVQGMVIVIGKANSVSVPGGSPATSSEPVTSTSGARKQLKFVTTCRDDLDPGDADKLVECRVALTEVDAPPGAPADSFGRLELTKVDLHPGALTIEGKLLDDARIQAGPSLVVQIDTQPEWGFDIFDTATLCGMGRGRTIDGEIVFQKPIFGCGGSFVLFNENRGWSTMALCQPNALQIVEDRLEVFRPRMLNPVVQLTFDPATQHGTLNIAIRHTQVPNEFLRSPYPFRAILRTTGGARMLMMPIPALSVAEEPVLEAVLAERQKIVCAAPYRLTPKQDAPAGSTLIDLLKPSARDIIPIDGAGPRPTPFDMRRAAATRVAGGPMLALALRGAGAGSLGPNAGVFDTSRSRKRLR